MYGYNAFKRAGTITETEDANKHEFDLLLPLDDDE
jgi:hypothetical protein